MIAFDPLKVQVGRVSGLASTAEGIEDVHSLFPFAPYENQSTQRVEADKIVFQRP